MEEIRDSAVVVGLVDCGPAKRQVSDSRTARIFIDGFSES
jgi:hypothetical protein